MQVAETIRGEAEPAPAQRARPGVYIAIVVCALLAAFGYRQRINGIFACPATGYAADAYLSDCLARNYGDFDHGSFWYRLDGPSSQSANQADVLFLGNSRMQFALSGRPLANWAAAASVRTYLLGFSHSENLRFYVPLLRSLEPRARAYVINVDRIFDDRLTWMTSEILRDPDAADRYRDKQRWQAVHQRICEAAPALCGNSWAVYRTRRSGAWTSFGTAAHFRPSGTSDAPPENQNRWPEYIRLAAEFLATLPVDPDCIVLTIVPSAESKTAEARAIAAALGRPLVIPQLEGLRTFDASHLDGPSADRWARAFLEAAGPQLAGCVQRG